MMSLRQRPDFPDRVIEPLDVRRKRQSEEGAQAFKEYRDAQRRTVERIGALRKARLERQSNERT
jgi:hypothetical protein